MSDSNPLQQQGLEAQLLPSPPDTPSTATYSNADQSARVYRFPTELPPSSFDSSQPSLNDRGESASASPPPLKVVTVRDLRNKSCWICSEEDEELTSPVSSPQLGRRKRFVHPCNCTLVAHESCLLQWIDQSHINHPLQETVTCPQCKAPFILEENKPLALLLLEKVDKWITYLVPISSAGAFGGSVLVASTAYGCFAIRMVLGKQAAQRVLSSPWPWHYWFDIPLIPAALIAARLRLFDSAITWLPTLVTFPIFQIPLTTTHWRLMNRYIDARMWNARPWPPGPALTALLVPWIRVFYMALKKRVYRAVLKPLLKKRSSRGAASTPPATESNGNRRRRRVIIVGNNNNHLMDGDQTGGGDVVQDIFNPMLDMDDEDNNNNAAQTTVLVSAHSLGRLCLGALSMPLIANWIGKLLGVLARHSKWLATFLGMQNHIVISKSDGSSIFSSYYTTTQSSTSKTSSASEPSLSPLAGLFRGQLPGFDTGSKRKGDSSKYNYDYEYRFGGNTRFYDDLDPVWFRNAIGAGIFIAFKDAAELLFEYLKLRQKSQTRIRDLPFQAGLVEGLDLKDD